MSPPNSTWSILIPEDGSSAFDLRKEMLQEARGVPGVPRAVQAGNQPLVGTWGCSQFCLARFVCLGETSAPDMFWERTGVCGLGERCREARLSSTGLAGCILLRVTEREARK